MVRDATAGGCVASRYPYTTRNPNSGSQLLRSRRIRTRSTPMTDAGSQAMPVPVNCLRYGSAAGSVAARAADEARPMTAPTPFRNEGRSSTVYGAATRNAAANAPAIAPAFRQRSRSPCWRAHPRAGTTRTIAAP
jgi:hypothetical protein